MFIRGKVWLFIVCGFCTGLIGNRFFDIFVVRDFCRSSRRQRRFSFQGWDSMVRVVVLFRLVIFQVGEAGKVFGFEVRAREGWGREVSFFRYIGVNFLLGVRLEGGIRIGGQVFVREVRFRSLGIEQSRLFFFEIFVLDVYSACALNLDGNFEVFRIFGGNKIKLQVFLGIILVKGEYIWV